MMIYYSIPYNTDKNLGKYYNDFMKILPNNDDFACFVDGDTIFTTPNYGHIIERVILENKNIGCFTALTNRVFCVWQVANGVDINNNDMEYHRTFGKNILEIYDTYCEDVTMKALMSGFLILINKKTWKKIGGFKEDGMLGIDNDLHLKIRKCREKMYMMKGIYLYHWYRYPNRSDISHLI